MITYGSTTLTSYNSIVNTEVYYYKSTSATELIGGTWSTEKPEWEDGKYIWQKIRTLYEDNTTSESDPVNITGQQGRSGISYKLSSSNTIIVKDKDGQLKINAITFSADVIQGSGSVESYNGRFIIEKYDGTQWVEETDYTSTEDENVKIYTIPTDISNIRCSLYQAGGFTELIDQITVPIIADGTDAVGLVENIPIYLASNEESGVTIFDEGWTRFKPELTSENKYLWMYYVSRYAKGDTTPQLIEAQGSIVNFENHGETSPLEQVIVDINYVQEGEGDPSPDNIRPIAGWDAINIISGNAPIRSYGNNKYELNLSDSLGTIDEDTLETIDTAVTIDGNIIVIKDGNPNIVIDFPESIGTVYGGSLNVTTGVLTVTYGYIDSYTGETINSVWVSDRDVYVEGTVPTTGAQVIYVLDTPTVYNLAPREVLGVYGVNNMQADTGNIHVSYYDNQTISAPFVDYALTSAIEMSEEAVSMVKAIYGICSTLNSIAIKNVRCDNFELYIGARIQVIFEDSNTVTQVIYLNVNNTSPLQISIQNEPVSATNQLIWSANTTLEFVFDGTYWQLQNAPFNLSGTSESIASDVNKLVTCGHSVICKGTLLSVYMENTNTNANACLNVDSTVPSIIYANGEPLSVNSRFNWRAETTQNFIFDGQIWRMDDDSVKALATAYITEIDDDGIMVHPEDDDTSGWAISDAIQLFKNGISYIKLWIENNIPKIRIGKEDQGHIILDNDSVDIRNDDTVLASFGATSVIGDTNDWHQTIAANQITFAKGDDIITYISPDKLYTINAEVADAFYISNYSIRNASDGKLVIGLRR